MFIIGAIFITSTSNAIPTAYRLNIVNKTPKPLHMKIEDPLNMYHMIDTGKKRGPDTQSYVIAPGVSQKLYFTLVGHVGEGSYWSDFSHEERVLQCQLRAPFTDLLALDFKGNTIGMVSGFTNLKYLNINVSGTTVSVTPNKYYDDLSGCAY